MKRSITLRWSLVIAAMVIITLLLSCLIFHFVFAGENVQQSPSMLMLELCLGILVIALMMLALSLYLGRWMVKRLLRPVETMAKNLDKLDKRDSQDLFIELEPIAEILREKHDALVSSSKQRVDFTANVSHELKTPLTAISGYAELIESGMATEGDLNRFAGEIRRNSKRLLVLIDDIIRLSELDSTQAELPKERLDLYEIAKNCMTTLQVNADNHQVTLHLNGVSTMLTANTMMMEELVYNLCDNAIRYNNMGGHVFVTVSKENNKILFQVKDTGIGIPKEHQERVFERFYRVDKSRSKQTGGTGLGLAIVKHVAAQHNAEIAVESEAGKGTTVSIVFPCL